MATDEQKARFNEWLARANRAVISLSGGAASLDDLADGPSWDSFAAGMTPKEYAREQLELNDFPFPEA